MADQVGVWLAEAEGVRLPVAEPLRLRVTDGLRLMEGLELSERRSQVGTLCVGPGSGTNTERGGCNPCQ